MVEAAAGTRRADAATRVRLIDLAREYRSATATSCSAACERVSRPHAPARRRGGARLRERDGRVPRRRARARRRLGHRRAPPGACAPPASAPGDEVLIQANAFVAAVEALRRRRRAARAGRHPARRPRPDPERPRARASAPRTRGILVVHLYGLPVDLGPILALARERGLVVIEDCSHAHGATLDGRCVGTLRRRRRLQPGRREEPRRLRRRRHGQHRRRRRSPSACSSSARTAR